MCLECLCKKEIRIFLYKNDVKFPTFWENKHSAHQIQVDKLDLKEVSKRG